MDAPGRPGISPTWSSSAKDMVATALGPSRLWATIGHGIVNELYWPSTGHPQIRDLGFIVASDDAWFELKRENRYSLSLPEPFVPLPRVVHEGEGYRLTLEVLCDPLRDVLLIRYALEGAGFRLYPLLAPHLGPDNGNNTAWIDNGQLYAHGGEDCLCLVATGGIERASAGFVGVSDGWQDFASNDRMRWTYESATGGNVALMAELANDNGVLALGFAETPEGARTLARSSLAEGFSAIAERFVSGWMDWGSSLDISHAHDTISQAAQRSAMVLKVHEDKRYPGAVTASLSVPWGSARNDLGGYHLVWARDAVEAGFGMIAAGQFADAERMLDYLIATQRADGHWTQNQFPDGRPFWSGIQLDEVGFPVLLAAKLDELGHLDEVEGLERMVRAALAFLAANGPVSPQDRWEENAGVSPFSIAIMVAALVAGSRWLDGDDRATALSLADYWNARIEDWTWSEAGPLSDGAGVSGYYVRLAPGVAPGDVRAPVTVRNRDGLTLAADQLVSLDFLYLSRLGLRAPDDRHMRDTLAVADRLLAVETPSGTGYHRYNEDGYGEHADGAPFDGTGIGRLWPLLGGERGHHALERGEDPTPWLQTIARMSGPGGLIPEQVWDAEPITERDLFPGKPAGSAMPLVWAHAEFLKLVHASASGLPLERLHSVRDRYAQKRPDASVWHWRVDAPFETLPTGHTLVVESSRPFRLALGFDGAAPVDEPVVPLGLGLHGVCLGSPRLYSAKHLSVHLVFDVGGVHDAGITLGKGS